MHFANEIRKKLTTVQLVNRIQNDIQVDIMRDT